MSNEYFFTVIRPILCKGTSASGIIAQMRSIIAKKQYAKWLIAKPILDSITQKIQEISVEVEDPTQQAIIYAQVQVLQEIQNNINNQITQDDVNCLTALQTLLDYK